MLISQQHASYNKYRASLPAEVRRLMDIIHGVPDGHRTVGQTGPEIHQQVATRARGLIARGIAVNEDIVIWGDDPFETIKWQAAQGLPVLVPIMANGDPDFSALNPAKDMIVPPGVKPFSPWGHRPDPDLNSDANNIEINGVGWLYPSIPNDIWDVGATASDADKRYEKTAWNGPYGHVIIEWERIA